MVNKNEYSLNDCQENWHKNIFFVFLKAVYSADEAGLDATLMLITNYTIKTSMKKLLSLLTVMAVAFQLMAAPVDVSTAKTKAEQYLAQKVYAGKIMAPGTADATLIKTEIGETAKAPVYYIFNTETSYVIVSGDDRAE